MKKLFTPLSFPVLSTLVLCLTTVTAMPVHAASGDAIPVSMSILPGLLTLYSSDHAELSDVTVSHTGGATSTGQLSIFGVDDSRGSSAGWNVSASFSDLVSYDNGTDNQGHVSPFTIHGTYNGSSDLDLTLTTGSLVNGSHLDQMSYTLYDQDGTRYTPGSVAILKASQSIGATGLSFDAPDIEYQPDTEYHLHIRVIAARMYQVEPGDIDSLAGSLNGVTKGLVNRPANSNDALTLAVAAPQSGDGFYRATTGLQLFVPAGAHTGTYHGQIIETIQ